MEEWKLEREKVKNELYGKDKKEIEVLKGKLIDIKNSEDIANIYWQLSEKYKSLFWGICTRVFYFQRYS